jgi:hypothetical protein
MKILLTAAALSVVALASPVFAAPVVLTCTGEATYTEAKTNQPPGDWESSQSRFAAEIVLDAEVPSLTFNGQRMVISAITDSDIVFATRKPGLMTTVGLTNTYVLSRRSGVLRFSSGSGSGSGVCRKVEQADKLF